MKRRGLLEKVLPPVAAYWNLAEEASSLRQLTQALVITLQVVLFVQLVWLHLMMVKVRNQQLQLF